MHQPPLVRSSAFCSIRLFQFLVSLILKQWNSHWNSYRILEYATCVIIPLCVRSTGLLLGSVGGSLTYIALLWCVWGLPICPWAVSVDLSCIVSFIVFDVMCVRCADLLLGCVGGPLMHHLVCYGVWWGLPTCSWAVSVGLSLCRIISFCCGHISGSLMHYLHIHCICVIIDVLVCEAHRPAPGRCRWVSHIYCFAVVCVRSTDLPVGCVGGSLMHRLIYCIWCDVCEVCRPAPGLRRWASHASSGMLWCVMRSADLLLGCVGGSLSLSHYLILLRCVWGLPICSWVMSVDLSRIYPILFLMCVGSTDLLLGYVGGPLMHRLNFYGVCEVYRPAPGLCRWVSHFSHFNIWIFCFVVIWLW